MPTAKDKVGFIASCANIQPQYDDFISKCTVGGFKGARATHFLGCSGDYINPMKYTL